MQYLEYAIVGVCLLIFLGVCGLVLVAVLAKVAGAKKPNATIYAIPPTERGTGQHTSFLDVAAVFSEEEDRRQRREKLRGKLFDLLQDAPPKA